MWLEIVALVLALVYFSWDKLFGNQPKNYPPGPFRFPLVGHLPLLGRDPLGSIKKLREKYGPIIGLRFGDFNVVMLHTHSIIKEAYDLHSFSGRPSLGPLVLIAGKEKRGLVAAEGPHWSEQRRFALRNLRDFGFGKKSMESMILEDVSELLQTIRKKGCEPVGTSRMLSIVVLSALWNIVAGERLGIDEQKSQALLDKLNAVISSTSISGPVFFLPWVAKLFPNLSGWTRFESAVDSVKSFISSKIHEHKSTFDPNASKDNLRDFMEVYLKEIESTSDPNCSFYKKVGEENMLVAMLNLFGAGAEPTSNTLNWAFYFLANNPEVQRKMQEELEGIVGQRLPSLDDRDKLLYTEAVIQEVYRKSSIIPFGVFHNTMEHVQFRGYELPKNTAVMANLYDVHHDIEVWGDPDNFRPERFLTPDGSKLLKPGDGSVGHVIPFLLGKRACLGETLARSEVFLILTSVILNFDIEMDPSPMEDKAVPSLIRFPPPHKLIFKERSV